MALGVTAMPEVAVGQTLYDLTQAGSLLVDQTYFFAGTRSRGGWQWFVWADGPPPKQRLRAGLQFRRISGDGGREKRHQFSLRQFRVPANPGGTVNGVAYYSFALDIDEGSGGDVPLRLARQASVLRSFD
jgi:hypothetical protein